MKKIFNYSQFVNEAFLPKDKQKAVDLMLQYLERKTNIRFFPYDEVWHIQKESLFLEGQLFVALKSPKALRFNWIPDDIRSEIHSVDLWLNFEFDTNPDFTLNFNELSVAKVLPDVVTFFNNPKNMVSARTSDSITEELGYDDEDEPSDPLEQEKRKLLRMRSPERIEQQKIKIKRLEAIISPKEVSSTDSQKVNQLDKELDIDVFKAIELYTIQVARGRSNSLIISGDAGIGKTQTVTDTLESLGMQEDVDYYFIKGTATTAGLYELLYTQNNKLIVFDDCDSVLKDAESINILKGALDTYDVRKISKLTKTNTFDSTGLSEEEIAEKVESTGKLPNRFNFRGKIIFISNLREDKFDKAILSRSLHVDVQLNRQELLDRMAVIMKRLSPDVDYDKKVEALEFLSEICENYPTKFDLNIRTLIHSINLRADNDVVLEGEEEPVWKSLIKKYLQVSRKK